MSLELRQLCKQVGPEIHLHDVSLTFEPGRFNVLLGPARAGKTSILRLVAGLDQADSGSILLHGNDITAADVRRRDIAFVYQEFVNYPTLTVFENIASPMRVRARPSAVIEATVERIAGLLGIESFLQRHPPTLSGGQQQRVAIARALAKDAKVVLFDEPLANLDYKLREDLRRELPRIFEGTGTIVLYAATDPDDAFLLGGNTIVLEKGVVSQVGPAHELFSRPANLAAAVTLSEFPLNLLPAVINDEKLEFDDQLSFPVPLHMRTLQEGDYTLGFRAEHLSLDVSVPAAAKIDAQVIVTEMTGNETIVHIELAGKPCVAVVDGTRAFESGTKINLFLDLDSSFVFDKNGRTRASPGIAPSRRV